MLRALDVRNFVIVESLSLEFGAGFGALTGETGAGKSILVDAIELLVGGRADAAVVREGAERAELSAEFDVPKKNPLTEWLAEKEFHGDEGQLILRRTIDRTGRSRSFINGHAATAAQVREAGEFLVDIHGQHAHQSLLRPASQRALLDAYGGAEDLAAATATAFREWKRLEAVALEAQKNHAAREAERAALQDEVTELKRLAPREGEWEQLSSELTRLQNGSSLLGGAQSALEALDESEEACLAQLAAITGRLRALSIHDAALGEIVELLGGAEAQAAEAARALRHYAQKVDLDPEALRRAEARIEALHATGRKLRLKPSELPARLAEGEKRLAELALAVNPEALQREVDAAAERYRAAAKKLSAKRAAAAQSLSKAVSAAMQQLAMAGGSFAAQLISLKDASAHGEEDIELHVSSHPSLPLRPLARVASGGELSRISLAIQMIAAKASPVATLVFDEVDSGIGGAVAETVGRALKKLGAERQVLCVTHLPQVAANATEQWSVTKGGTRGRLGVKVERLDRKARIDELARMLGGSETTARKHAAELLDAA